MNAELLMKIILTFMILMAQGAIVSLFIVIWKGGLSQ